MLKFFLILTCLWTSLTAGPPAWAAEETSVRQNRGKAQEIVVVGKLYCSIKRSLFMSYAGIITSVRTNIGQAVREGEEVARYKLDQLSTLGLYNRVGQLNIRDREFQLANLEHDIKKTEANVRELRRLAQEKLAASENLKQVEEYLQVLQKQRALLQKKLQSEREFAQEDLKVLNHQLGVPLKPGQVPKEAVLKAPMTGHIIYLHPDLKEGGELLQGAPVMTVGSMNPMLLRVQVHEIEMVNMKIGDKAEFTVDSLPGHKYTGQVSRIAWSPTNPQWEQPSYYEVELTVTNPDLTLKEGLRCQVTFLRGK
ncbi:MAG: efflux RND transporter periplasmic adaptor subunit [Thermodesulfobacteriota bacterium]